jgi:hypothetical protein
VVIEKGSHQADRLPALGLAAADVSAAIISPVPLPATTFSTFPATVRTLAVLTC